MFSKVLLGLLIGALFAAPPHHGDSSHDPKDAHAAHEPNETHEAEPVSTAFEVPVRQMGADFKLPSSLWDQLLIDDEKVAKQASGGGHGGKQTHSADEMMVSSYSYAPVAVLLKEKTPGVLREREIRLKLPDGGAEIDLSSWTTGQTGSFFVQFEWGGTKPEATYPKAYFYSRARKRKVGDQVIGTGCKTYLDMTKSVLEQSKTGGWTVNTARNFHSTVLGGHFLFSWSEGPTKKITRVTFTDSRNPSFFCETL